MTKKLVSEFGISIPIDYTHYNRYKTINFNNDWALLAGISNEINQYKSLTLNGIQLIRNASTCLIEHSVLSLKPDKLKRIIDLRLRDMESISMTNCYLYLDPGIIKSAFSYHYFDLRVFSGVLTPIKSIYKGEQVRYYSGFGLVALREDGILKDIMWSLVIRNEVVKYIPCFTNTVNTIELPTKYLQLWVNSNLKDHPHLLSYFKKVVVPKCEELDIQIIEKDSFVELFQRFDIPKVTSLSEQQQVFKQEVFKRLCQSPSLA
jgi:hypothetical protein